ncbi:hypothetical protein D9M71_379420 [compost metagenome]
MQVHCAAALLLFQGLAQDLRKPLITLATQALVDVGHALQHALGKQPAAVFVTVHADEFGTQIDHVVAQDAFHAVGKAVLQPHQRVLLHALIQLQRHRAAAHNPAFILQHELLDATGAFLQHVDGQLVLEVDLRRLRGGALAEAGAAMVGVAFQIEHVAQLVQHVGLAGAGQAAHQHEIALLYRLLGGLQQEGTHGLVATFDARVLDARLIAQPALHDLRAQAATEAVQVALGVGLGERCPGLQACLLGGAADQLVAQGDGGGLALLLVAGANPLPLLVVHQRQVGHAGEGALGEFDRGAHVHHRHVVEEQLAEVGAVGAHQITSTAWLCRSTSLPIGDSCMPSPAATARNSASPSAVTATSRPPLVCGSHSRCFCSSLRAPILWP